MRASNRHPVLALVLVAMLLVTMVAGCDSAEPESGGSDGGTEGSGEGGEATKDPYRIGAVVSLTGTYAGLGEPEKNTLEMEVERINDAGGIDGHPIEVIIEDDATDEAQAVSAASKLIEQDEVLAIIGATGSGQTMAMRTEIDRAGIPQVSMAGATAITAQFDPLVFQTPWSNTLVVPYLLKYMQDKGIAKVAVISDSGGFGKDGVAVTEKNSSEFGIDIVASETFNAGDADMSTQLTKIKGSGADALLVWSAGKEAATIVQNAAQLQIGMPIYGTHGNARREFIDGAGEAAEGFTFPAGKVLIPDAYGEGTEGYETATSFIERYEEQFDAKPSTFAGHAYDALYIITEAMGRLDEGFTPAELRDEIEKTNGFVGIGGTFTFSETDHNGMTQDDLVMYTIKNGEWTLTE